MLPFPWVRNPRFDPTLAMFSFVSLLYGNSVEELIFRGYSFERLIAGIGHWKAQLVTAILFAVFHIGCAWTRSTATRWRCGCQGEQLKPPRVPTRERSTARQTSADSQHDTHVSLSL